MLRSMFEVSRKGRFVRSVLFFSLLKGRWRWIYDYLARPITLTNYPRLFRKKPGMLAGELTPAYARLDADMISNMAAAMPDTKIIYLLRNPVDRVWSQVNMFYRRDNLHSTLLPGEVLELKSPMIYDNSSYIANLSRWEEHFGAGNVYVGFFDEIRDSPYEALRKIYAFLGLRTDENVFSADIHVVRNQGRHGDIPENLEYELSLHFLPELEALHRRFGNQYTAVWLQRAQDLTRKPAPQS